MIDKKTWDDFRQTGLLLFVNQFLHIFGWSIVVNIDDGGDVSAYPARVKFRGFDDKSTGDAYVKISNYISENADAIKEEANL